MSLSQRKEPPGRSPGARCSRAWLPQREALGTEGRRGPATCCLRSSTYWGLTEAGREAPGRRVMLPVASPDLSRPGGCRSNDDTFPGHGMAPRPGPLGPAGSHADSRGPVECLPLDPARVFPPLPSPAKVTAFGRPRPCGDSVTLLWPCLTLQQVLCLSAGLWVPPTAAARLSRGSGHMRRPEPHARPQGPACAEAEAAWRGDPAPWLSPCEPRQAGHPCGTCRRLPQVPTTASMHSGTPARTRTLSLPRGGVRPGYLDRAGLANAFPGEGPPCTGKPLGVITMEPCPHSQSPRDLDGWVAPDTELPRPLRNRLVAQTQGRAEGAARPPSAGPSPAPRGRPPRAQLPPVGSSRAQPPGHAGPRPEAR